MGVFQSECLRVAFFVHQDAAEGLVGEAHCFSEEGEATFVGVPEAYRGLFLIDKEGVVRHQIVNDMPLGRNVDEALRLVDALQYSEEHGEVCPANWQKGDRALKENADSIASYLGAK